MGNFFINQLSASAAGPGHWNDPDMLQIGNGVLTTTEERTHFAMWAFAKAPLIIGCDINTISADSLTILKNKNMIAINQDSKGKQAVCVEGCKPIPLNYHIYQT
jgi:alpha-galactosidase